MTGSEDSVGAIHRRSFVGGAAVAGTLALAGVQSLGRTKDDWQSPEVVMTLDQDRGLPDEAVVGLDTDATQLGDADALVVEVGSTEKRYEPGGWPWFGPATPLQRVSVWAVRSEAGREWRTLVWDKWLTEDGFKDGDVRD